MTRWVVLGVMYAEPSGTVPALLAYAKGFTTTIKCSCMDLSVRSSIRQNPRAVPEKGEVMISEHTLSHPSAEISTLVSGVTRNSKAFYEWKTGGQIPCLARVFSIFLLYYTVRALASPTAGIPSPQGEGSYLDRCRRTRCRD